MSDAKLSARVAFAYDDLLTEFCEDMQKVIDRGEADEDEIGAAIQSFDPFNDALYDAWTDWVQDA